MTQAGRVLSPDEVVKYNGLYFEVDRVEQRRVINLRLKLPEASTEPEGFETAEGARAGG